MSDAGAARFARFAHPPSALGYCGPPDEPLTPEADPAAVARVAPRFEGAWPYLSIIARQAGLDDPLDERVVEAYWLGGELSAGVATDVLGAWLRDRFGDRLGVPWAEVEAALDAGGRPTHAFHVFGASPWVGLLARGLVAEPLRVLDGCRIAWGEVVAVDGDGGASVLTTPLTWEDGRLALGAPVEVAYHVAGGAGGRPPSPGETVACHWDWVCEVLDPPGLARLRADTNLQLEAVQRRLRMLRRP